MAYTDAVLESDTHASNSFEDHSGYLLLESQEGQRETALSRTQQRKENLPTELKFAMDL